MLRQQESQRQNLVWLACLAAKNKYITKSGAW
jgi:hypothetical protein